MRTAVWAAAMGLASLVPAGAASAAPIRAAAQPSAYVAPVEQAQTVQLRAFGWVYKGFYRRTLGCQTRANWYRQHHMRARCNPVFVEGAVRPIGFNLYVRTRIFPDR